MDGGTMLSECAESSRPDSPVGDDEDAVLDELPDAGGGGPRKRKGKSTRWNIPTNALSTLEQVFGKDKFPSVETRKKIAADLKVTPRQVQVWFQNKRQRSTKPPGRPTDARNMLQTSVRIARPRPVTSPLGSRTSPRPPAPAVRFPPGLQTLRAAAARGVGGDVGTFTAPLRTRACRICPLRTPTWSAPATRALCPAPVPTGPSLPRCFAG